MRVGIVCLALAAAVFGLASPLFQKIFIDRLMGLPDSISQRLFGAEVFAAVATPVIIVLAFFCAILGSACSIAASWFGLRESVFAQEAIGEKLYRKTLRMRTDQLAGRPVGEIVAIYATDVIGATAILEQTLPMGAGVLFPLMLAPLAVHWIVGVPLSATITFVAFVVAINAVLSLRQSRFFMRFKQLAAERTGLVGEWIQNMRLLRVLGWMESYERRIFAKRIEETANRIDMVTNGQMMGAIGSSISFFINLTGIATVVYLRDGETSPGELLAMLWIFGVFLARPFRAIPWIFTFLLDALTSLRRVESFLLAPDSRESHEVVPRDLSAAKSMAVPAVPPVIEEAEAIVVRGLDLTIGGKHLLNNIDFTIKRGEFVAIVGEVGSGKSLLILSLMGETGATFSEYRLHGQDAKTMALDQRRGHFSYVPQEGFVMSASLRENVVLDYGIGVEVDAAVLESLARAQFRLEGENVEGGLDAEIGERGVNLSGGQRQRVSLARADQHAARPVLLLDDCLSAVDVDTERRLIDDLLTGSWRDRTRILVTHRLSVLEYVDRILFIEDGRVQAQGSFESLLASDEKFRHFMTTAAQGSGLIPLPEQDEVVNAGR